MQVNKRTAVEQEQRRIKKLKDNLERAEEAVEKYSKEPASNTEDEDNNIDAELISHQAQDYAEAQEEAAAATATSFAQSAQEESENVANTEPQEPQHGSQQVLHQSSDKPLAGSDEWHRIRKDNHKEVERRRRENINAGIKELAALLPGQETNKAQILQRAIEHIKRLKENENNNNEKWTLEKFLNDQTLAELSGANEKLKAELERAYREVEHWKQACSSQKEEK